MSMLTPLPNARKDFTLCPCGALSVDPFPTRENGCAYCPECGHYVTDNPLTIQERFEEVRYLAHEEGVLDGAKQERERIIALLAPGGFNGAHIFNADHSINTEALRAFLALKA